MNKILMLIFTLLLSGCSLGPVKVKPTKYYTLEPVPVKRTYAKRGVLAIEVPKAEQGLQSNAMLYSEREFQINAYTYSKWSATPTNLLHDLLLESFNKSGMFRAVISNPYSKSANWALRIRILHWHQSFLENPSEIVVSYIANIYDLRRHRIVASKLFETVIPCDTDDAYGGVVAMNDAMIDLIPSTLDFVRRNAR